MKSLEWGCQFGNEIVCARNHSDWKLMVLQLKLGSYSIW